MMYALPGMEDIGLNEGQEWPSETHRIVAQNVCLCNEFCSNADDMHAMVQAIIAVPEDELKEATLETLAKKHKVPNIVVRLS